MFIELTNSLTRKPVIINTDNIVAVSNNGVETEIIGVHGSIFLVDEPYNKVKALLTKTPLCE